MADYVILDGKRHVFPRECESDLGKRAAFVASLTKEPAKPVIKEK